jgi:hypothetical protein
MVIKTKRSNEVPEADRLMTANFMPPRSGRAREGSVLE